ncbi:MAG: glycerophosphoryl diester phosphodiesterase membrane domain-containing protein [Methanomicrobia archaeon]|nr:glycerophosphoryl diester phosphodiesterase membrane domain-containing protein [Methanomicrobia archaeon]
MNEIGISMVYDLEKRGEIDISSAFNKCFSFDRLPSILVSSLLVEIIVLAGLLALVIPGLYLMCRLSLTEHATAIEEKGAIESIKMSWDITKGRAGEIFGILLESGLFSIVFVIPALILILIGIVSGIEVAVITIIATGIGFIAFIFSLALPVIATTYYYLEITKQGGDGYYQ